MPPRPARYLAEFGKRYSRAWRQVDEIRANRRRDLPDWPEWCFLPLSGSYTIVSGGGTNRLSGCRGGAHSQERALKSRKP